MLPAGVFSIVVGVGTVQILASAPAPPGALPTTAAASGELSAYHHTLNPRVLFRSWPLTLGPWELCPPLLHPQVHLSAFLNLKSPSADPGPCTPRRFSHHCCSFSTFNRPGLDPDFGVCTSSKCALCTSRRFGKNHSSLEPSS